MNVDGSDAITPAQREAIDKALEPYRNEAMNEVSMFYGVDIRLLPREDLLALCFWIANHARDKRKDH